MDKQSNFLYYYAMPDYTRVTIRRLARFYCPPDWRWQVKGLSRWRGETARKVRFNYDLWTVLQGCGTIKTLKRNYALQAGDCFILRGDEQYRASHDPRDPLVVFAVHFDFLNRRGQVLHPQTQLHRKIYDLEFFAHILERMETAWYEGNKTNAERWLQACLMEIAQQDREEARHGFKREQAELIRTICREIRRQPSRTYRLNDMAKRLHCTRYHFSRLFKEINGITPRAFIVNVRIETAKGLLHASSYSISRIAELLGYKDVYFFSRQFKEKTGMTPSKYRGDMHPLKESERSS